jgi:ceramide glucosyltransferase
VLNKVLAILYALLLEAVVGFQSVAQGLGWRRMVRRHIASEKAPSGAKVALICPCKGMEADLEENLTALTRFDYPSYEVFFVTASLDDAAASVIVRVAAGRTRKAKAVHHVVAGPPDGCSEKVNNLRAAAAQLNQDFGVLTFVDSDALLDRGWLARMVTSLERNPTGAVTSFRWLLPRGGVSSKMASAWNASILGLLGDHARNFCWGGATAIYRSTFAEIGAPEAWRGALSDDFALTRALRRARRRIDFAPECLAPTRAEFSLRTLAEFTNRQMIITRVYEPRLWFFGALSHGLYVLSILGAAVAVCRSSIESAVRVSAAALALLIMLLAAAKACIRSKAVREVLPSARKEFLRSGFAPCLLAPLVPFLYVMNFAVSAISRRIIWRGVRYELVSPEATRIID